MFTGLVEATGTVVSVTPSASGTRITIASGEIAGRLRTGDSVAVSGVCLTALDIAATQFSADLAAETITRTTLSRLKAGSAVNLELPTPAGAPLGGHVVQGHVDGTAVLLGFEPIHPGVEGSDWRLKFRLPPELVKYVVPQGSIAVEGISLTVAKMVGDQVEIAIIPHTYHATSLKTLKPGDDLNIEVDVLGKYAERLTSPPWVLTERYLLAHGY